MPIQISCPSCGTKLQVPSKLASSGQAVKCPQCSTLIAIPAKAVPAPTPTEPRWYAARNGKRQGPFTYPQVQQLALAGKLQPTDMLWQEGTATWIAADSLADLAFPPTQPPPSASKVGEAHPGPAAVDAEARLPQGENPWDDLHSEEPERKRVPRRNFWPLLLGLLAAGLCVPCLGGIIWVARSQRPIEAGQGTTATPGKKSPAVEREEARSRRLKELQQRIDKHQADLQEAIRDAEAANQAKAEHDAAWRIAWGSRDDPPPNDVFKRRLEQMKNDTDAIKQKTFKLMDMQREYDQLSRELRKEQVRLDSEK